MCLSAIQMAWGKDGFNNRFHEPLDLISGLYSSAVPYHGFLSSPLLDHLKLLWQS